MLLEDCRDQINGILHDFALLGNNSNWVCSDSAFTSAICCTASFIIAQQGCGVVGFNNITIGDYTYVWDFGDGTGSTQTSPGHTYPAPGTYTVILTATPVAGGTPCLVQQTVTVVVDAVPPVMTCPPPKIVVQGSLAIGGAIVNWPEPTAADDCPGVTLTGSQPNGSFFDCGTTNTVIYVATDASGNTATCVFTVTVICDTMPTCACGSFTNLTFGAQDSAAQSFNCGDSCPITGTTFVLGGNFACAPGSNCTPSGIQLVNSAGATIGSGTLTGTSFTWSFSGNQINNPGLYELYLRGDCGQQTCQCVVRFVVEECPPGGGFPGFACGEAIFSCFSGWTAGKMGQVFHIAIDNQDNVYVGTTVMHGQFKPGSLPGAGPGTIYKIDAATGAPSVWAA